MKNQSRLIDKKLRQMDISKHKIEKSKKKNGRRKNKRKMKLKQNLKQNLKKKWKEKREELGKIKRKKMKKNPNDFSREGFGI